MTNGTWSPPTRAALPLILIRGFGGIGVEDEKRIAYQGFNDGTVYPHKRGENYIYEGMVLRFMKSDWKYRDATNVVGFFNRTIQVDTPLPDGLEHLDPKYFTGDKVVLDAGMAQHLLRSSRGDDVRRTLWIFRYYDLDDRKLEVYGRALVRVIDFIRDLAAEQGQPKPKVNLIAHSMGGLLVRQAVQVTYPKESRRADEHVNKIVTLGTPHRGIAFQFLENWIKIDAAKELEAFNPKRQADPKNPAGFGRIHEHFPLERLLTVVGTNYRTYSVDVASWLNRVFSMTGEGGMNYNRSDGLVKQTSAQIPGAPRTFVHKCHGGFDSLVTSREAFEIATRFFFGNVRARLRLVDAKVLRGKDFFGRSEFFFGVSIKPRGVDFDLFHQSAEAENCYGPFSKDDLSDDLSKSPMAWAGDGRLIWEGYLDLNLRKHSSQDMVFRVDFYVGERDTYGVGFSDNLIFRKQYYVRVLPDAKPLQLFRHDSERFQERGFVPPEEDRMLATHSGWFFTVKGTGFEAKLGVEIDEVPEVGEPKPLLP